MHGCWHETVWVVDDMLPICTCCASGFFTWNHSTQVAQTVHHIFDAPQAISFVLISPKGHLSIFGRAQMSVVPGIMPWVKRMDSYSLSNRVNSLKSPDIKHTCPTTFGHSNPQDLIEGTVQQSALLLQ